MKAIALAVLLLPLPAAAVISSCPNPITTYEGSFIVRKVVIDQPFRLVAVMNSLIDGQEAALQRQLVGKPFSRSSADWGAKRLESALDSLPFIPGSIKVRVIPISIEQCADGQLDLRYKIFAAFLPTSSARFGEVVSAIFLTPASAAPGNDQGFKILPAISYDESRRLLLGGSAAMTRNIGCSHFLQPAILRVSGAASSVAHKTAVEATGNCESNHYSEWLAGYTFSDLPTMSGQSGVRLGRIFYQRDFPQSKRLDFRVGGAFEGGSYFTNDFRGPQAVVPTTDFAGFRAVTGVNYRTEKQAFEVSYGLQLSKNFSEAHSWFSKNVLNLNYQSWLPLADHRSLETDLTFSLGKLTSFESVPFSARFLLNSASENFVPSQTWNIVENPVMRSVSSRKSAHLASGAGAESFASISATIGVSLLRYPLVPKALGGDPDFLNAVAFAFDSAKGVLANDYKTKDPHFVAAKAMVISLDGEAQKLKDLLETLRPSITGSQTEDFQDCLDQIGTVHRRVDGALSSTSADSLGFVSDLADADGSVSDLLSSCNDILNAELANGSVTASTQSIESIRTRIKGQVDLIDEASATAKATRDLQSVQPVFNLLVHDINTASLSPVIAIDFTHLSPVSPGKIGTLFGLGPGIRFSLLSSVSFTGGYSFNLRSRSILGSGGFFGKISFRDLFQF